jgi:hypothetical protein
VDPDPQHWVRSSLRHFIGALPPSCANGDADQILSANYEPDSTSRIFFLFGPSLFLLSKHLVHKLIGAL